MTLSTQEFLFMLKRKRQSIQDRFCDKLWTQNCFLPMKWTPLLPASREERKECGAIMENLALPSETPCSRYAICLPSGSRMRVALGGGMYTFFGNGTELWCSEFTFNTANYSQVNLIYNEICSAINVYDKLRGTQADAGVWTQNRKFFMFVTNGFQSSRRQWKKQNHPNPHQKTTAAATTIK